MKCSRKKVLARVLACSLFLGGFSACGAMPQLPGMESTVTVAQAATAGQRNAVLRAQSYLSLSPTSKKSLKEVLKSDGATNREANYAVNHCGANWKKQAAALATIYHTKNKKASRAKIKQRLMKEGFTKAQAEYGVKNYSSALLKAYPENIIKYI